MGHLFGFLGLTALKNETYFPYIQSLAVLVFFLLSGFLSDFSLENKPQNYSLKAYLKNHLVRIYGSFLPALLLIAVVDLWAILQTPEAYRHYSSFSLGNFLKNLLMLPPVFQPFGSGRPLWTLYLEWWLYIVYGYGMLVCRKKYEQGNLTVFHIILFAVLVYIPFQNSNRIPLIAFVLGIIINRIYREIRKPAVFLIILSVVFFLLWSAHIRNAYHITETILLALILLQLLVRGQCICSKQNATARKLLRFFSGCTFPLYLIHYTILEFIIYQYPEVAAWSKFWICFVTSNIAAVFFYIGVPKITTFIHKLFPNT